MLKEEEVKARRSAKQKAQAEAKAELKTIGKQISSLVDKINREEDAAVEAYNKHAGESTSLREHLAAKLAEAEPICKAAGMKVKDLKAEYIGDRLGDTQFKQILRVARGQITFQQIKAQEAGRKQEARKRSGQANVPTTPKVTLGNGEVFPTASLTPAAQQRVAEAVGSAATEISTDAAKARMAALAGEAPPTAPTLTAEEISDEALAAFTRCCQENGPKWTEADEKKARVYFNQREYLPRSQRKIAA
jgi:hypothetical protein